MSVNQKQLLKKRHSTSLNKKVAVAVAGILPEQKAQVSKITNDFNKDSAENLVKSAIKDFQVEQQFEAQKVDFRRFHSHEKGLK